MKKNGKVLILILFTLATISTSLYAQITEVEKWSIRGDEYYKNRDYANAIKAYTQVIELRLKEEDDAQ